MILRKPFCIPYVWFEPSCLGWHRLFNRHNTRSYKCCFHKFSFEIFILLVNNFGIIPYNFVCESHTCQPYMFWLHIHDHIYTGYTISCAKHTVLIFTDT